MSYDEYEDNKRHIIIDNGSGYIKAGFSGEEEPRSVFPSIVGYPKFIKHFIFARGQKEFYIGSNAEAIRGVLKLKYPINTDL